MADELQFRVGADLGGALSALNALKEAVTDATAPVSQLKIAFADAGAAIQENGAATVAAFKANMQEMVAAHRVSLDQALGFDIEYTAQRNSEERTRLEAVVAGDAATLAQKSASYGQLVELSARYSAQLAQDQMRVAEAAQKVAGQIAVSFRHAFDAIGGSLERALTDLLLHKGTRQNIAKELYQALVGEGVGLVGSTLGKAAAGLVPGSRPGEDLGAALSTFISHQLLQLAELVTHTALLSGRRPTRCSPAATPTSRSSAIPAPALSPARRSSWGRARPCRISPSRSPGSRSGRSGRSIPVTPTRPRLSTIS
ncbi:MAG: hypothetical protein ACHQC9_03140 [Alphaproteobacteria bacterium]